ncbi:hypothetical protein [Pyrococcus yayanosii]|uniref:Uncharacterized protein n=1 Tax=Pyrococcus yayanosii (strain CH1 / JCM 16557) TaxID=529709 RepID=F8AFS0_PYRYC|nr:hypothetical protein [Pyrococcus yayanosii]AEH23821.1 hypothetical protein PYCH_01120 [Pyrococcus yayanosii CH1]
MIERLIKPAFVLIEAETEMERREIEKELRRKGFHIAELFGEGYELESLVESFIEMTSGKFVYLIKARDGKVLARGSEAGVRSLKIEKEYIVRSEKALVNLILMKESRNKKALRTAVLIGLAAVVGLLLNSGEDFSWIWIGGTAIAGSELMKALEYLLLGYREKEKSEKPKKRRRKNKKEDKKENRHRRAFRGFRKPSKPPEEEKGEQPSGGHPSEELSY